MVKIPLSKRVREDIEQFVKSYQKKIELVHRAYPYAHLKDVAFVVACGAIEHNACNSLLDIGADVNCLNGKPLIDACMNGHTSIVNFLILNDAFVGIDHNAPIKNAIHNNHTEIVSILLNHGVIFPTENTDTLAFSPEELITKIYS